MKNWLCNNVAIIMLAGCNATLAPAQNLNVRQFERTVDPRNVTTTDKITWYAGESIEYIIHSRRGPAVVDVPLDSSVVWRVHDATGDYIVASGEVLTNGSTRFFVDSPNANLPAGTYTSWATAHQGTNLLGVLDRTTVEVRWRPGDDYQMVPPITNLFDQVMAAWNLASGYALDAALSAVSNLASVTTQQLADAVAPLATTQALADAVAPLATTGYVAAAVAPLATTQQLADAVAPLATTGDVAAAVAPLASTQQLADAVAPANIYGMLADVGVEIVEDADDYYIASVSDHRTGASISFDAMHIYARPEMPWNFVGGPPPTISGVPIATTQALADAVAPLATTQALAEAVAPLLTNAATWWTYPAGGDVGMGGHSITNVSEVLVQYADGGSKLFIEPGGIRSSIGLNLVMDESRIEGLYFVDTPNNKGLLIDDAYAITDSTIRLAHNVTATTDITLDSGQQYQWSIGAIENEYVVLVGITTTNSPNRSSVRLSFVGSGSGQIFSFNPGCYGTEELVWIPAQQNDNFYIEAHANAPDPAPSAPPTITKLRAWVLANSMLVAREHELTGQIFLVDDPAEPRQIANLRSAEAEAAEALDLALDEVWHRTASTDLQGNTMRFNPRYDIYGTNDLLNFKFGGETMLQFDGTGSKVIPEIRSFSVGPGTTAEMTVWSYAGGETNLVPEVSTNLQDWLRLDASAIVSAAMLDQYTAKIVFTNSAPKAQFVRLVDVSGGEGDPVVRVLAAMELGGVKSTTWPGLPALDVVDVGDIPGEGNVEWTWTVNAAAPARTIVFSDPSATDKHPILIWPPPYTPAAVQEVKVISPPNGMSLAYAEEFDNAATGETAYYAYTFYPAHNAWYLSGWSSEMYNLQPVIPGWSPP